MSIAKCLKKYRAGTINCDQYQSFCSEYGISSYPHYQAFTPGGSQAGSELFDVNMMSANSALDLTATVVKMMAAAHAETAETAEIFGHDDL